MTRCQLRKAVFTAGRVVKGAGVAAAGIVVCLLVPRPSRRRGCGCSDPVVFGHDCRRDA